MVGSWLCWARMGPHPSPAPPSDFSYYHLFIFLWIFCRLRRRGAIGGVVGGGIFYCCVNFQSFCVITANFVFFSGYFAGCGEEDWLEEDLVKGRITPLVAESLLCQQLKKTQVETNEISQDFDFDFDTFLSDPSPIIGYACH